MISKKTVYISILQSVVFSLVYCLVRILIFDSKNESVFIGAILGGFLLFLFSIIKAKPVGNKNIH